MKYDDKLNEVFNIEPEPEKVTKTEIVSADGEIIKTPDENIEDDYQRTRGNLHQLLQQGQDALIHALDVAKQSEHPRAFEVVGNLIKQLSDVNQQLLDIHLQKKKIEEPSKHEVAAKQVTNNNAIFVGSTSELNKLIQNMTKGEQ